jgi:hypothetical protein
MAKAENNDDCKQQTVIVCIGYTCTMLHARIPLYGSLSRPTQISHDSFSVHAEGNVRE